MRILSILLTASMLGLFSTNGALADDSAGQACMPGLDQEYKLLHSSKTINLCESFRGRPMLIVNTASHCGFTPQFKALETIHQNYAGQGLAVIGVPSNDFFQESSDQAKTAEVCYINYGVTFTMLAPQKVKGADAVEFFRHVSSATQPPRWNFTKYLVSSTGEVAHRFGSNVEPDSAQVVEAIESLVNPPRSHTSG